MSISRFLKFPCAVRCGLLVLSLVAAGTCLGEGAASPCTCTWTGAAGDGKWATAGNWDIAPVSGRGDTIIIKNAGEDVTAYQSISVTLDETGFSAEAFQFGDKTNHPGTATVTISGAGSLTLSGSAPWQCFEAATCDIPVTFTHATAVTIHAGRNAIFNAAVTVTGTDFGFDRSKVHDAKSPEYVQEGSVKFYAPVSAPDACLHSVWGSMTIYFYDTVDCAKLRPGYGNTNGYFELYKPGSHVGVYEEYYWGYLRVKAAGVLSEDCVLSWSHNYPSGDTGNDLLELSADQTVDRIIGNIPYYNNTTTVTPGSTRNQISTTDTKTAATLTLKATKSADCWSICNRGISIVYDPQGDFTQTFCDRTSAMTGTIRVKGGTLLSCGSNTFANVTQLTVDAGARFGVSTSCVYEVTLNPFADKTSLRLAAGGKLSVPADVTMTFKAALTNGLPVQAGVYQGADGTDGNATRVDWIEGEGLVSVASVDGTYWSNPAGGDFADPSNWSNGLPGDAKTAYFMDAAEPYVVTIGDGALWPKTLVLSGPNKTLKVAADTDVMVDGDGKMSSILLENGAELLVSGHLVLTNFSGSFTVRSATDATSTVRVTGAFDWVPKLKADAMSLEKGGAIHADGGTFTGIALDLDHSAPTVNTKGGQLRGSGSGTVWFKGAKYGGANPLLDVDALFADDSCVRWSTLNGGGLSYQWYPEAGQTMNLVFTNRACLATGCDGLLIGGADGSAVSVTFASVTNHAQLGYRTQVIAQGSGTAEMTVAAGVVPCGGRGLDVAYVGDAAKALSSVRRSGHLAVTGGTLEIDADNKYWNDQFKDNGLVVGVALAAQYTGTEKIAFGEVDLSGGEVKNRCGLMAGGGQGVGTVRQTGGTFTQGASWNSIPAYFALGVARGQGTYQQAGGTLNVACAAWFGGFRKDVFQNPPENEKGFFCWTDDFHDAEGEFAFSDGTASFAKKVVLGAEGVGRLVRSGVNGTLTIDGDLVFSNAVENAASGGELVCRFDDVEGFKAIPVSGKVIVGPNAKVSVDLGAYAGRSKALLSATGGFVKPTGEAATLDDFVVTIAGDTLEAHEAKAYLRDGVLGVRIPHGNLIILR